MKRLILTAFTLLFSIGTPVFAAPVLKTDSGICHCPGGQYYDGITRGVSFGDLQSCLADGGREPKRGQGNCAGASAAPAAQTRAPAATSAPAAGAIAAMPRAQSGQPRYDRDEFGAGWLDGNGDCMNTRHEILMTTSTGRVNTSRNGCSVVQGRWLDPYTDQIFTNPRDLDIDHIVPLSFAWQHGAYTWSRETREKFANDPVNLIAVEASENRQKSDSGPLKWLPSNVEYRCEYILRFTRISKSYNLVFDPQEARDMQDLQAFLCN